MRWPCAFALCTSFMRWRPFSIQRYTYRNRDRDTDIERETWIWRQACTQTDKQANKQTDRRSDIQTQRHINIWAQAPKPPETHNHKYIDKTLKLMQGLMRLKRNLSRVKVPWLTPWAFMPFGFLFMRLYALPTPCGKLLYAALCPFSFDTFSFKYNIVH